MMLSAVTNRAKAATQVKQMTSLQKAVLSYYHNFHHPTIMYVNGRKHTTDYNTDLYKPYIRSFLTKRWTTKREIPPKISIMKDMGPDYKQIYYQQRLPFSEFQYGTKHLERLYEAENPNT